MFVSLEIVMLLVQLWFDGEVKLLCSKLFVVLQWSCRLKRCSMRWMRFRASWVCF